MSRLNSGAKKEEGDMTPEEIAEMANGGIPVPMGSAVATNQITQIKPVIDNFIYYRKCPTCGHLEELGSSNIPREYSQTSIPEFSREPVINIPDKVSVLNNGKDLSDGGVEAEWR